MIKDKLWVFGDSYSVHWLQWPKVGKWYNTNTITYTDWHTRVHGKPPTHFSDVVQSHLGIYKVVNKSIGGNCNYSIMDSIGRVINQIQPHDYVIVGWSGIERYRYIEPAWNNWRRIMAGQPEQSESQERQLVDRVNKKVLDEIRHWQQILLKALPEKTFFWSPFLPHIGLEEYYPFPCVPQPITRTITIGTNGKIEDGHWDSESHRDIGTWLINELSDNRFRKQRVI